MCGTNRGSFARQAIRHCTLLCCGVCVLFSLAPAADFDLDGSFDTLSTDGCMVNAAPSFELLALLPRQATPDQVRPAEPFSAPIPHPLTL